MDVITIGAMSASGELSIKFFERYLVLFLKAAKRILGQITAFTLIFLNVRTVMIIYSEEENGKKPLVAEYIFV